MRVHTCVCAWSDGSHTLIRFFFITFLLFLLLLQQRVQRMSCIQGGAFPTSAITKHQHHRKEFIKTSNLPLSHFEGAGEKKKILIVRRGREREKKSIVMHLRRLFLLLVLLPSHGGIGRAHKQAHQQAPPASKRKREEGKAHLPSAKETVF